MKEISTDRGREREATEASKRRKEEILKKAAKLNPEEVLTGAVKQIMSGGNAVSGPGTKDEAVNFLGSATARLTGGDPAVSFRQRRWSKKELVERKVFRGGPSTGAGTQQPVSKDKSNGGQPTQKVTPKAKAKPKATAKAKPKAAQARGGSSNEPAGRGGGRGSAKGQGRGGKGKGKSKGSGKGKDR